MASNRPGGLGGLDIWVAHRPSKDVGFGAPENLGEPVNSAADDFCPTPIRGKGLFFISREPLAGSCGLGDIYFSRENPAHGWSEPTHLGCAPDGPNTALDEMGPSYVETDSGASLYYSSSSATVPGDIFVSDGYGNTRVVKFDKNGKMLAQWGQKGQNNTDERPAYFNNVHGVAVDPKTLRVFVNDRGNHRVQVFDKDGKFLDQWSFGPNPADIHLFHIFSDGYLWAFDRGTSKMLKYDLNGNFMYSFGTWGDFPGAFWGVHGFSVDTDGNVYTAAVDTGGAQKLVPRKGANPAMMIGKPIRAAWQN